MNRIRRIEKLGIGVLLSAMAASVAALRCDHAVTSALRLPPAPMAGGCTGRFANHRLDFWLGDWVVYAKGAVDGTSHIVAILDGCAVQEEWTDITGDQGRSWFYVDPGTGLLKQVWLTTRANELGGTKEKAEMPGGGPRTVQFQGVLGAKSGEQLADRTTLTLQPDDTVRQVIELSNDGGRTWNAQYDAVYRRSRPLMHYPPRM